jgi:excinuclease UvrABC nuclease subunit
MGDSIEDRLMGRWQLFSARIESLLQSDSIPIGEANPPEEPGIYVLLDESMRVLYVGLATNLRDRLHKHVSGDESHAIQRAFKEHFPDRSERRRFIKRNVSVKWELVDDPVQLADTERLLIWLLQPVWNRQ